MASSSHPPNSLSPHPNHGFQVLSRTPSSIQKNISLSLPLQVWKANSLDTEEFFRAKKNSKLPLGFSNVTIILGLLVVLSIFMPQDSSDDLAEPGARDLFGMPCAPHGTRDCKAFLLPGNLLFFKLINYCLFALGFIAVCGFSLVAVHRLLMFRSMGSRVPTQ